MMLPPLNKSEYIEGKGQGCDSQDESEKRHYKGVNQYASAIIRGIILNNGSIHVRPTNISNFEERWLFG